MQVSTVLRERALIRLTVNPYPKNTNSRSARMCIYHANGKPNHKDNVHFSEMTVLNPIST